MVLDETTRTNLAKIDLILTQLTHFASAGMFSAAHVIVDSRRKNADAVPGTEFGPKLKEGMTSRGWLTGDLIVDPIQYQTNASLLSDIKSRVWGERVAQWPFNQMYKSTFTYVYSFARSPERFIFHLDTQDFGYARTEGAPFVQSCIHLLKAQSRLYACDLYHYGHALATVRLVTKKSHDELEVGTVHTIGSKDGPFQGYPMFSTEIFVMDTHKMQQSWPFAPGAVSSQPELMLQLFRSYAFYTLSLGPEGTTPQLLHVGRSGSKREIRVPGVAAC